MLHVFVHHGEIYSITTANFILFTLAAVSTHCIMLLESMLGYVIDPLTTGPAIYKKLQREFGTKGPLLDIEV